MIQCYLQVQNTTFYIFFTLVSACFFVLRDSRYLPCFDVCLFNHRDAGDGLAGMKQGDLIIWYVEQQNAKGAYSSTAEVKEEVKCIKAIIEVSPAVLCMGCMVC
jgi:hypothetical protein